MKGDVMDDFLNFMAEAAARKEPSLVGFCVIVLVCSFLFICAGMVGIGIGHLMYRFGAAFLLVFPIAALVVIVVAYWRRDTP